ncbi:PLP-dependent aminotransferase family protein [Oligella urethralis]|uniref:MocR-like pyridoxine biosynthesis transcription factor PdxR n=1 Tax=Oligella urethralis TaxID=90245 RepID=UPI002430DF88|nr:PLP-dependent aminotransferase family protein [Oligella urethralis]
MHIDALQEHILQRLERDGEIPLARQIYIILSDLILSGELSAGVKLPASRSLATDCGVSRNTIMFAYEQLLAEGYVISQTGSGTFVSDTVPVADWSQEESALKEKSPMTEHQRYLSKRGSELVSSAQASAEQWQPFVSGVPDVSLFPKDIWLRLLRKHWQQATPAMLSYAHGAGYLPLRQALIERLRLARSVNGTAEQVLMISGLHNAISLIAHLLIDPGMTVWMENPGYWGAATVLKMAGANIVPIAIDEEGLAPTPEQIAQPPKLIFVTPSHQYPLGHVMSLARRRMLLDYANAHDAWIIEDDYDSEFRFAGLPIASLQGLDSYQKVIYLGTFSKTLFPGMRLGYMVLPENLVDYFAIGLSEKYRDGRLLEQAVLADFMVEGHYAAHVRRSRLRYAKRSVLLREAINEQLGPDWVSSNVEAGLHLVIHLPAGTDDVTIARAAKAAGIMVRPLSRYYLGEPSRAGVLLGYANVPDELIKPRFAQLARIIRSELRA